MREHDAAARRMVVGGAVVLAAALGALGAAGATILRMDRAAGRREAETRLREIVDEALYRLASTAGSERMLHFDERFRCDNVIEPRPFDPLPEVRDQEARFLLAQADGEGSGPLRRAALRLAAESADPVARLAAEWRLVAEGQPPADRWDVPGPLSLTREAVALGLRRGEPVSTSRARRALGSDDDEAAAALLVKFGRNGPASTLSDVHRWRQQASLLPVVAGVLPSLADREAPSAPGVWFRCGFLEDGSVVAALRHDEGCWTAGRVGTEEARRLVDALLHPRGVRIARVGSEPADGTVASIEFSPGWEASFVRPDDGPEARPPVLLVGLAVAAIAAVTAYAAFVRAVRREARAAAARADFVATVSHELRTPVAVVRTSAETLLADRAPRDEDRRTLLGAILRESERLSGLLGNVLDFARIDAGTRRYAFRDVPVRDLVEETVRRTAPALAAGGFRADVVVSEDPGVLHADPDALGAALANLLDNAAKFRGTGGLAAVRVSGDAASVTIDVEDRGLGVPDAEKAHVFERFFRGSDPRVRETRGSGIGLALVRHAVEAHGGRVTVRDTPGGGATFRVVLPRRGRD